MARKFVKVKVTGLPKVKREMARLGRKAPQILGSAMFNVGEEIIGLAKEKFVPVVTNALRSSGFVEMPVIRAGGVFVELGFGGPAGKGNVGGDKNSEKVGYALRVHENSRTGKTGGISPKGKPYKHWSRVGQWKYLQTPFQMAQRRLDDRLVELMRIAEPRFR